LKIILNKCIIIERNDMNIIAAKIKKRLEEMKKICFITSDILD